MTRRTGLRSRRLLRAGFRCRTPDPNIPSPRPKPLHYRPSDLRPEGKVAALRPYDLRSSEDDSGAMGCAGCSCTGFWFVFMFIQFFKTVQTKPAGSENMRSVFADLRPGRLRSAAASGSEHHGHNKGLSLSCAEHNKEKSHLD